MMDEHLYQMGLCLLVEENLFRVDYPSATHPQILLDDLVVAENATILELG